MIKHEYLRFMQTLRESNVTDSVRKVANIIEDHLDKIIPLSTQHGHRIKEVVKLTTANWETAATQIPDISEASDEKTQQFSQLEKLTVGPFRGFAQQEEFDLNSRLVLIYGTNGTGKSSFCEALEYALLGNVSEAENRRFHDQREYFKNAFTNEFSKPKVVAKDKQGKSIEVTSNEAIYRFCFIEKNRIDSFSRIAAQAPAKQTELIATLFGLESFSEFVRNFTSEISEQYIDLKGKNKLLLEEKQNPLLLAKQQIKKIDDIVLPQIIKEEQSLITAYKAGMKFEEMVLELVGDEQTLGKITQLNSELQQLLPPKSGVSNKELENLKRETSEIFTELTKKQQKLKSENQKVSFKKLYEALKKIQQSSPQACPACHTPLSKVIVNPFRHAEQELQKLQQLTMLEQEINTTRENFQNNISKIFEILNICLKSYLDKNPLKSFEKINTDPKIWFESLLKPASDNHTGWQHLAAQVEKLETSDKKVDKELSLRESKKHKLTELRDLERRADLLKNRKETATKEKDANNKIISNFERENSQLIKDAEDEKGNIARNNEITLAYRVFSQNLKNYINNLPGKLVTDLECKVIALYNAFNRSDKKIELLANVKLPLNQNQRLEISFQDNKDKFYDALHILSEGHIRCLGLAILLAKNLKEQSPVLIFDDPVNAIDDEHRESIRKTLFEDACFSNKQIILACHGEEFFKDIQNLLSVTEANKSKRITFLPKLDKRHICVNFACASRNYISAARAHIEKNEIRDALDKSRKALESLTKGKVWKYVERHGDSTLKILLRSPSSPIELRNLTEQLRSKITNLAPSTQNKSDILDPINTLLGCNGGSREWRYLNTGTHENSDRAEFDRGTVDLIITSLEKIDAAVHKGKDAKA